MSTFSHSREGGNPEDFTVDCEYLGTRLRGHDVVGNREIIRDPARVRSCRSIPAGYVEARRASDRCRPS